MKPHVEKSPAPPSTANSVPLHYTSGTSSASLGPHPRSRSSPTYTASTSSSPGPSIDQVGALARLLPSTTSSRNCPRERKAAASTLHLARQVSLKNGVQMEHNQPLSYIRTTMHKHEPHTDHNAVSAIVSSTTPPPPPPSHASHCRDHGGLGRLAEFMRPAR